MSKIGEDSEDDEYSDSYPPSKRLAPMSTNEFLAHILNEVQEIKMCMNSRLTCLELKTSVLVQTCHQMAKKIDVIERSLKQNDFDKCLGEQMKETRVAPILITNGSMGGSTSNCDPQVISLTSEKDFPNGSWIGDPESAGKRVRCSITPQNLHHINSTCATAEKMALVLVDYLFTREEIATSNLSGRGRWNKKQLNPVMVFGIQCHLQYKFGISNKDWHRIKLNIDSKCRSAWKRRLKKINSGAQSKHNPKIGHTPIRKDPSLNEEIAFDFDQLRNSNIDLSCVKVITRSPCELQILNASEEAINQLPDSQEIILAEEQVLSGTNDNKNILMSNSGVSINTVVMDTDNLESGLNISANNHHESLTMEDEGQHHSSLAIDEDHTESSNMQHITLKDDVSLKDDRPSSIHQIDLKEAQSSAIHHITIKDEITIKHHDVDLDITDNETLHDTLTLQVDQHGILERDSENDD